MDSLGLMVMPETLVITKAFDQQYGPWPMKFQFLMQIDVHINTQTDTQCNSISYSNLLCIFMHTVSGTIHGILVRNKIEYPIASEGLHPPDPLLQRFNTEGSPLSKSQIYP